jgi:putative peptidoglycan lipid II flippase
VASSVGKVSVSTAFSRVLGLIREQVMAYFFGAGLATDAFVAAFRVPNLLRDLFAEGALSSAFIPVFKDKMVKAGNTHAFKLASLTISALLLIVGFIVAVGIIASPLIIYVSANGFTEDSAKFILTVNLTRIMFVYLLLVSVSAVFMGILNSFGRFGVPALSPALFNIGMILSPILLYKYFDVPIYTLAIGVIVGGIGQLVFQLPSLLKIGFHFTLMIDFADEGIRRIGRLISPMILGLSASRINILINTLLASLLIEGAMSYLNYSYRLMHFPLGVFGVALGSFYEAIGLAMFLVIPSAVYLAGFGEDIVRLIYQRGAFGPEATAQTARALFFYSFGLVGFAGVRVTAPLYYALGDSKRPMNFSIAAVVINIALNFAFIPIWGFAGLAAATSVAGLTNMFLLIYFLRKKIEGIDYLYLAGHIVKIILGAVAAFLIIQGFNFYVIVEPDSLTAKVAIVFMQIAGMGILYIFFLWLLKVEEVKKIRRLIIPRLRNHS